MISVVVPVFGCTVTLDSLVDQVSDATSTLGSALEVILVDDGNNDETWSVISSLARRAPEVSGIKLSRNFGQQAAIMAGLRASSGELVVVMDCDLQDRPADIPKLLRELEGHDVVIGLRVINHGSKLRLIQSSLYAKVLRLIAGHHIDVRAGSFSVLRRCVVNEYIKFSENDHHYLYILAWLGFRTKYVELERDTREFGSSTYSFAKRLRHAAHGLLFFSPRILYSSVLVGLAITIIGISLLGFVFSGAIFGSPVSGWASLMSVMLLFSGVNILFLSLLGIYIGRIFAQSKNRPLYVVAEII